MKQRFLKLINSILWKYFSCNIVHKRLTLDSYFEVWKNIKRTGIEPDQIFDIGAARGEWTKELLNLFPNANYLKFDPLKENEILHKLRMLSFGWKNYYRPGLLYDKAQDIESCGSSITKSVTKCLVRIRSFFRWCTQTPFGSNRIE